MFKIIIYCLVVILALFSNSVLAEGGAYQLELIIFSQSMPNTETFEQTVSQIIWPSGLTELSVYSKPDTLSLTDGYTAISKDLTYQSILHVAWIQQGPNAPVHIQSTDGKLNGYVQLQQESGLQMMVDLELASNPGEIIYRLIEKRSIKLNEVYYLDHPKFAVIAKISSF